jgi:hypothetical protein
MSVDTFKLPDLIASSPLTTFEFSPSAKDEAAALLAAEPEAIFQRLIEDQETEPALLAARRVVYAFLRSGAADDALTDDALTEDASADAIAARVAAVRAELSATTDALKDYEPDIRETVLRQRAPVALVGGCWLDTISQPATQPSVIVNRLFQHHVVLKGHGNPQRSLHQVRRRAIEAGGAFLPEIGAEDFLRKVQARPLTALHASFYIGLSRLPVSHLPEVVGVHYTFHALGVDDLLTDAPMPIGEPALRETLAAYIDLTLRSPNGPGERRRLLSVIRLVLALEREHVAMLAELAAWRGGLSLDAQVAEIIAQHAPYAGRMHREVRVAGRPLTETFRDPAFDVAAFMHDFRRSPQLKRRPGGTRFLNAIKFGGPMFGIFNDREAAILKDWVAEVQAGDMQDVEPPVNHVGDAQAARWHDVITRSEPDDVVFAEPPPIDDRELLYRLVNIEHFPNTRPYAMRRALDGFNDGEILFTYGAQGRYTDAGYFDYNPAALRDRVAAVYWDKLVNSYEPLEEIPGRDEVILGQRKMALGNLIEAAWSYRIGNLGRFDRPSDGLMFAIYADEMGRGDVDKNHVKIIHDVMDSMSVHLPHVRDAAFRDQELLPDTSYYFPVHQLCMAIFPDTFYCEILGYNLGIEMNGLGTVRMHEIDRLRAHGFDTSYEEVHLTIDNVSTGHSKQSVDVIVSYLDEVARAHGDAVVQDEWRRMWRGYAAFAQFIEHELVKTLPPAGVTAGGSAEPGADRDDSELMI